MIQTIKYYYDRPFAHYLYKYSKSGTQKTALETSRACIRFRLLTGIRTLEIPVWMSHDRQPQELSKSGT